MKAPEHPSVERIRHVALALADINESVVYIGGAIAPLLQTESSFRSARVTKDVDAIGAASTYSAHGSLQAALRTRGFREDVSGTGHAHRWIARNGIVFDLVPAGTYLGASGQAWDRIAVDTAEPFEIAPGLVIRHASAPAFLALKWAAFADRGAGDPFSSHDLEDILALIAGRPSITSEVSGSVQEIAKFVRDSSRQLLAHASVEDLLAGCLSNALDPETTITVVRDRLVALAE